MLLHLIFNAVVFAVYSYVLYGIFVTKKITHKEIITYGTSIFLVAGLISIAGHFYLML